MQYPVRCVFLILLKLIYKGEYTHKTHGTKKRRILENLTLAYPPTIGGVFFRWQSCWQRL